MKIIVLQDYLRSGGTERHSILLTREFATLGHASELVTFRPGGILAPTAGCPRRALQPFDTRIDWFGPGLMRAVLDGSDIVLCMGKTANCFAGRIQVKAATRGMRTQVIATLRAGDKLPSFYYSSVRRAAHMVTNSHEAADSLVNQHGLDRRGITVIHNSLVFPESYVGRDIALRSSLGAGAETTVYLSVAMFRPSKNQQALLDVVAGLPKEGDWRLWLLGDGPEKAACERHAARLGLGDRVRFLGFHQDPAPYYRAADIAIHASREEALSNFIIEAQSHGLPAVACRALGMQECFVPGRTGWMIEQGDYAGFRAALALLARDTPAERSARAAEAREFTRRSFDPARQVGAYISLFESLLKDPRPSPTQ